MAGSIFIFLIKMMEIITERIGKVETTSLLITRNFHHPQTVLAYLFIHKHDGGMSFDPSRWHACVSFRYSCLQGSSKTLIEKKKQPLFRFFFLNLCLHLRLSHYFCDFFSSLPSSLLVNCVIYFVTFRYFFSNYLHFLKR